MWISETALARLHQSKEKDRVQVQVCWPKSRCARIDMLRRAAQRMRCSSESWYEKIFLIRKRGEPVTMRIETWIFARAPQAQNNTLVLTRRICRLVNLLACSTESWDIGPMIAAQNSSGAKIKVFGKTFMSWNLKHWSRPRMGQLLSLNIGEADFVVQHRGRTWIGMADCVVHHRNGTPLSVRVPLKHVVKENAL